MRLGKGSTSAAAIEPWTPGHVDHGQREDADQDHRLFGEDVEGVRHVHDRRVRRRPAAGLGQRGTEVAREGRAVGAQHLGVLDAQAGDGTRRRRFEARMAFGSSFDMGRGAARIR
jgi:hypothetical protein